MYFICPPLAGTLIGGWGVGVVPYNEDTNPGYKLQSILMSICKVPSIPHSYLITGCTTWWMPPVEKECLPLWSTWCHPWFFLSSRCSNFNFVITSFFISKLFLTGVELRHILCFLMKETQATISKQLPSRNSKR